MDVVIADVLAGLLTIREAAQVLRVLPRTVRNRMARQGIAPIEFGDQLLVRRDDLPRLQAQPRLPPPPGRRRRRREGISPMALATLRLLDDWEEATADELAVGLDRHPGNVRKYLTILRHEGLAEASPEPALPAPSNWLVTDTGRELLATTGRTEAAA